MLEERKNPYEHFTSSLSFLRSAQEKFGTNSRGYTRIKEAHDFAEEIFLHRKRQSGEPYLEHLVFVASFLLHLGVRSEDVIMAGLLHDLCEDIKGWHFFRVWRNFNLKIALHVGFVTKISPESGIPREWRRGIFYLLLAHGPVHSKLLKLCDRIHNLRTVHSIEKWKQERMLKESAEKYAPLAQDIEHLFPGIYKMLQDAIAYGTEQLHTHETSK